MKLTFSKLKPCCVSISRLAIRLPEGPVPAGELIQLTQELFDILSRQINQDGSVMDEKLADYIFFPLSHIFRNKERYPARLIELAMKCLAILVEDGWKAKISTQLTQQLVILLTFIIGGIPGQEQQNNPPEETVLDAFRALTAVVTAAGSSPSGAAALVESSAIPALGHCVTVILEGVTDGFTADIQVEALKTLQALFVAIKDDAALATFLPGTVSTLAKLLSAPVGKRRRVLVAGLQALKLVLVRVLGDIRTRKISSNADRKSKGDEDKSKVLTPAWLTATASQIKLALSTVLKIRTHEAEDVQKALERLCVALLDECHTSLSACAPILVETAMILSHLSRPAPLTETNLQDLVGIYPELGESVKTSVYNWVMTLPRLMQASDETAKQRAIQNLAKGVETLSELQIDSTTLDDSMALALRDSISALIAGTKQGKIYSESSVDQRLLQSNVLINRDSSDANYSPILISQESQAATRKGMLSLISKIGAGSRQMKLASEMLDFVRESDGDSQLSAYWLSFELVKASVAGSSDIDAFLDLSSITGPLEDQEQALHDLYDFSVTVLDSHTELSEVDWRMEGIALEVAAFAASRSGPSFRPELIDILYPIATFLGSQNVKLRDHAVITLNSLAFSCGYGNVSELIIGNVDYMLNSVSMRLNTFDISPASTKVLRMMVRLTGPKLVPFLDDVIASIFTALDNYHGYPLFVESLFAVLKEVVDQGVKSDRLLLEAGPSTKVEHRKRRPKETTLADVLELLDRRSQRIAKQALDLEAGRSEGGHPMQPWKSEKGNELDGEGDAPDAQGAKEVDEKKPPKTPTYTLLEKVANLTQHYLTSPTPTLRKSLLDLLGTVSPALAADEDSYLPLVNAVWPVVIGRLYDSEPYVVIAACDALCVLCSAAGDFLSSRIKTEWWDRLGKWCRKAKLEAGKASTRTSGRQGLRPAGAGTGIVLPIRSGNVLEGKKSTEVGMSTATSGGLGRFASTAQLWEAAVRLLVAVISYVRVEDEVYDQILDILADTLAQNQEAREALEVVNADAVWLAMYERGQVDPISAPVVDGVEFFQMGRFSS
jgi:TELO2-interacting protein 1